MTSGSDIFEQAKLWLPKYLTPERTKELYSELVRFPDITSFYFDGGDLRAQLLQGDGWSGFVAIKFSTGDRKSVSGIIISNSCDISPDNPRNTPMKVLFAPLISLARYGEVLRSCGKDETQIQSVLTSIRSQHITYIFYLPSCPGVTEESLILLDDIHSHPLEDFLGGERKCLFKLNQTFFYIFLIKLSIHFSRFQEGIQRFDGAA